jgi:hypothetical protein
MEFSILNSTPVFIEINANTLKAVRASETVELPLERAGDGSLIAACRVKLVTNLGKFVGRKSWQPRGRAYCAIAANGLILRQFSLPLAGGNFQQLLRLQIESEFPLPPEELAWGWRPLAQSPGKQEVLVAAVRKEIIAEYAAVLTAAGLNPVFTPAALARNELCPATTGSHAILEIGGLSSELALFKDGVAESVRMLAWGRDNLEAAPGSVAKVFGEGWQGRKIYLSGNATALAATAAMLYQRWNLASEPLEISAGKTAAMLGMEKLAALDDGLLRLGTSAKPSGRRIDFSGPETKLWLQRAAVLLALALLFPYVEALLLKPFVAKKYAVAKAEKDRMIAVVDPELRFLQSLKQNQPPYLDALFLFAKATPSGARIDPISMNQRGEISLRAVFQNGQQVSDFRAKLNEGGMFTNIVVEEQAPTPDRQKVNVRMSAKWNVAAFRAGIKADPAPAENAQNKHDGNAAPTGGLPPPNAVKPPKP